MKTYAMHNPPARQANDLYCTNPIAVQMLLDREKFDKNVWECCNGLGHITRTLESNGYKVRKSDIINYNNEDDVEIIDMLTYDKPFDGDIITNPPYKYSTEIAQKCIELAKGKVALYSSLTFLATQKRKPLFEKYPPKTVYIMSKRISCAKEGDFNNVNGAIDYCWVVWDKNYNGSTEIVWI
jgi:hypothetical protein